MISSTQEHPPPPPHRQLGTIRCGLLSPGSLYGTGAYASGFVTQGGASFLEEFFLATEHIRNRCGESGRRPGGGLNMKQHPNPLLCLEGACLHPLEAYVMNRRSCPLGSLLGPHAGPLCCARALRRVSPRSVYACRPKTCPSVAPGRPERSRGD